MLTHVRRNAVAYLALFAALTGTSYAAVRLGRNAVKGRNIADNAITSPKVRDGSLLAKDFAAGQLPAGAKGDAGATGDAGPTGPQGPKGDTGPAGPSALTALKPGATESGAFAIGGGTAGSETFLSAVSFPIPLAAGLDAAHAVYVTGASATHCPGRGEADSGYLCLYETTHSTITGIHVRDPTSNALADGSGADGFLLTATDAGAANPSVYAVGTWSVTG